MDGESVFSKTSGGSELIKSGPGMIHGYILTSGSPLGSGASNCIIAYYDNTIATGNTSANMLAHGQAAGATAGLSIVWTPTYPHVFSRGLWLSTVSGSPVITTSYS